MTFKKMIGVILSITALSVSAKEEIGNWIVYSHTDDLRKTVSYRAMTTDKKGESVLAIFCNRNSGVNALVFYGEYLGKDPRKAVYRIDDKDIVSMYWDTSGNGTSIIAYDPDELASKLKNGYEFVIETKDYQGVPHQASFSLLGSKEAINKILGECG